MGVERPPIFVFMSDRTKYIIATWVAAGVFAVLYFLFFTFVPRDYSMMGWTNVFFRTGILILLTGALQAVYYFGAFEMFQYGFMQIFHYMRPNAGPMKHKDFAEYREYRVEKRKKAPLYPWPWIILGATFALCSLIFWFQIRH